MATVLLILPHLSVLVKFNFKKFLDWGFKMKKQKQNKKHSQCTKATSRSSVDVFMVLMFRAAGSRSVLRVSVWLDEITVWLLTFQQPLRLSSAARAYTHVSQTTDGVGRCAGVSRAPFCATPAVSREGDRSWFYFERGPLFDPPSWYLTQDDSSQFVLTWLSWFEQRSSNTEA